MVIAIRNFELLNPRIVRYLDSLKKGVFMERTQKHLIVIVFAGWILALAQGCSYTNIDDQRYASLRYTYPYQPNQSQDKEYEHPGNPIKHHYYD